MLGRKRRHTGAPPKRRRKIRKLRLLSLVAVLAALAFTSFAFGMLTAVAAQIPALDPRHEQSVDGYVYASDGQTVLAVLRGRESRVLVDEKDIAPAMFQAIVAIEDKRFYEHRGVDVHGIARAVWADVTHKGVVEGGSTITQQFVKNTYVKRQRTISRKLKEAALAWQLEQRWKKDKILTAYLNTIYFGHGAYGVEQASRTYFGHGAKKLTWAQAALLAGIPQDPTLYDPVSSPRESRLRRNEVLLRMLQQNRIGRADYLKALRARLPRAGDVHLGGIQGPAPYFGEYVKQQLIHKYGSGKVFGGGLRVKTTIDLRLQKLARAAISKWLPDPEGPQAALVAIDPRTGRVVAMFGGNSYQQSQFNLAVQGERQPGSSFKPFVLSAALREGIAPETTFNSGPVLISLGDRYWSVHNYENSNLGTVDLTTATIYSDNTVYAQLTRLVGPAQVAKTATLLGITRKLNPYFAIGLGADPVSPLEMARAFSAFANGGARIDGSAFGNTPRAILTVRDVHGNVVDANKTKRVPVLTRDQAALVDSILEGVVREGTGRNAALPGRPAAGKTGTTENYGDAWFVGFTPQLVTAVWVGYPSKLRPMMTEYHGDPVAGGTFPAQIWKTFMQAALGARGDPPQPFPTPSLPWTAPKTIAWRDGKVQLDNGYCRDTATVVYFNGAGPPGTANCKPHEVDVPRVVGQSVSRATARLEAQPLTAALVYAPAKPGRPVNVVLRQYPAKGHLSSYDKVTLVVARSQHGVVPSVVGLSLRRAQIRLRRVKLAPVVSRFADGVPGHVVSQSPGPGIAAAPGMNVTLVVARG